MNTETLTLVLLWVHVPFAVAWIGVAILDAFLAIAPGLSTGQRGSLIRLTLPFVYVAIPVIVLTGIWQTVYNPVTKPMWSFQILDELKTTTYGWALYYKHIFVFITLVATLTLKLVLVRQLGTTQAVPQSGGGTVAVALPDVAGPAVQAGAWVNVLSCLGILICVVLMVWQLH